MFPRILLYSLCYAAFLLLLITISDWYQGNQYSGAYVLLLGFPIWFMAPWIWIIIVVAAQMSRKWSLVVPPLVLVVCLFGGLIAGFDLRGVPGLTVLFLMEYVYCGLVLHAIRNKPV